jgi:hypothetical protein
VMYERLCLQMDSTPSSSKLDMSHALSASLTNPPTLVAASSMLVQQRYERSLILHLGT